VKNELEKLPYRFKGLELDEIIIMPDHIHVVILLREKDGIFDEQAEKPKRPQKGSLGVIVRSFKSSVSVRVHQILKNDMDVWQRNYYEEYIEDDEKLDCIREYIQNNPFKESCGE
jgi:REP element-mobilizing transposase RayT